MPWFEIHSGGFDMWQPERARRPKRFFSTDEVREYLKQCDLSGDAKRGGWLVVEKEMDGKRDKVLHVRNHRDFLDKENQ